MPSYPDDLIDDPLQVGVGAGDDPAEHVAGAGDRVRLEDLGDVGQVLGDGGMAVPLADLQGDETRDAEADHVGCDVRAEASDRAPRDQFVQPGLDRATGDRQAPGEFQDADPRLVVEQGEQAGVQRVELYILLSHSDQTPYRMRRLTIFLPTIAQSKRTH